MQRKSRVEASLLNVLLVGGWFVVLTLISPHSGIDSLSCTGERAWVVFKFDFDGFLESSIETVDIIDDTFAQFANQNLTKHNSSDSKRVGHWIFKKKPWLSRRRAKEKMTMVSQETFSRMSVGFWRRKKKHTSYKRCAMTSVGEQANGTANDDGLGNMPSGCLGAGCRHSAKGKRR